MPSNARKLKKPDTVGNLVVVESPAKAKTVGNILGKNYHIIASLGHVRDLPKGVLGIDVDGEFAPSYTVMKARASVVKELKKLGQSAKSIYLATDPDREGEAISWHLVKAAGWDDSQNLQRVVFHEITEEGIKEAFRNPRDLDMDLVNAQQARRILDRLVGYQLSPLLWQKVQRGLSAGRVQSVALRLVVDREREIESFVPKEYWTIEAMLKKETSQLTATLQGMKGVRGKMEIPDEQRTNDIVQDLQGGTYLVSRVKNEEKRRRPSPPFITSTLQQEAWRKLRFSSKKTMLLAQQLYEGLPLGAEGSVGLITYMRTDSTSLAIIAVKEAREYIKLSFGGEYTPKESRVYKSKTKGAQEAHEAIRPTTVARTPEKLKESLSRDQLLLYDLIWRRMLASQMVDALHDTTTVDVDASSAQSNKTYIFRATGSVVKFPGFRVLYMEDEDEGSERVTEPLPQITVGDRLFCQELRSSQHFTQPPPRYNEASLIKLLEEQGIGRPSTYAPTLSTIVDRHYVLKEGGRFKSTALGLQVSDLLTRFFPDIMDVGFTARMEDQLDEIAQGERQLLPMLQGFYTPFKKTLDEASEKMPRVKVEEATDEICSQCGSPMVIKVGRFGRFISCSNFPTCRNSKPIVKRTGVVCPSCGGDLVERRSKVKRRLFYGCSNYPTCNFSVLQRPLSQPCPECDGLMVSGGRTGAKCTACAWTGDRNISDSEVGTNE